MYTPPDSSAAPAPPVAPPAPESAARRWLRPLIEPGPAIEPRHYRVWMMLSVCTVSAIVVHLLYTALFALLGVHQMVLANLLSLPLYVLAWALTRRGRYLSTVLVAMAELLYHQTLAVHYLGWDAGLQYFLLVLPPIIFSLPAGRNLLKAALVLGASLGFLALLIALADATPVHAIDPRALSVLNVVSVVTVFGLLGFFAGSNTSATESAERRLREEYQRAETLLHNILPVPIAERLKRSHGVIADGFPDASVLFADIVGFTDLSACRSPEALVAMLNDLFSGFDGLVERHGLEKIKTIGDAYMVAAGIPAPIADHATVLADLALDMQAMIARKNRELETPLQMRIGIHSGPVVAGVIGRTKFIYDLWGDTVNVAARMESHGVIGQIQVTSATHAKLERSYQFESRGAIEVKGKGPMEVFLLLGRATTAASADTSA